MRLNLPPGSRPWIAVAFALLLAGLYLPGHMAETVLARPLLGGSLRIGPLSWAILFMAGSMGLGALFLRLTGQRPETLSMGLFLSASLGSGFMSCLIVLLMALGLSGKGPMIAVVAIPLLGLPALADGFLRSTASSSLTLVRRHPLMVLATVMFILANLAGSLAPVTSYDDQVYHLPLAKAYASRGLMIPDGTISQAYKPFLGLAPYIWVYLVCPYKGPTDPGIVCQAIHALFGILAALGCYAGARVLCSNFSDPATRTRTSLLSALLFLATPQTAILSASAYVDLFETALELAVVVSLAMALPGLGAQKREGMRHLVNAGIAGGLAAGIKYTMLYTGAAAVGAMVFLAFTSRGKDGPPGQQDTIIPRGPALKGVAVFGVIAAVIVAPFFAWTWYFTGNPVFPHFPGLFKSTLTDETADGLKRTVETPGFEYFKGRFGPERTLAGILTLPITPFTNSYIHTKARSLRYFDGMLSPQVLMGLGFLVIPALRRLESRTWDPQGRVVPFLALFGLLRLVVWACGTLQARFLFSLVPVLAILSALGVTLALQGPRRAGMAAVTLMILVMGFNFLFSSARLCERGTLDYVSGAVDREQFLMSHLPFYRNFMFINANVPPGARVAPLYEPRIYYLERPVKWCGETGTWPVNVFFGSDTTPEVCQRFRKMGIEYIFLPIHGVKFLQEILHGAGNPGVEGYTARLEDFLRNWVDYLNFDRFGTVVRIRDFPKAPEAVPGK